MVRTTRHIFNEILLTPVIETSRCLDEFSILSHVRMQMNLKSALYCVRLVWNRCKTMDGNRYSRNNRGVVVIRKKFLKRVRSFWSLAVLLLFIRAYSLGVSLYFSASYITLNKNVTLSITPKTLIWFSWAPRASRISRSVCTMVQMASSINRALADSESQVFVNTTFFDWGYFFYRACKDEY